MYNDNYDKQNAKKRMRIIICIIVFVVLALIAFLISFIIVKHFNKSLSANSVNNTTVLETSDNESDASYNKTESETISAPVISDVSNIVKEVLPSVVAISGKGTTQYIDFFGRSTEYESESKGSGIIYSQQDNILYLVTNAHVINDAKTINVTFYDDTICEAQIIGSLTDVDIAVISVDLNKLDKKTLSAIKVSAIGNSDTLKIGEPTIAIGNAMGYGQSVTTGIVSALNRKVTIDGVTKEVIQTDAAINPGNSGGALLNSKGEVIGINSAKTISTEIEGVGYAIPISTAKPLIEDIINNADKSGVSSTSPAYLGIFGVTVDKDTAKKYDMPLGVYVTSIEKDSTAQKCGIEKGDIITAIDSITLSSADDLEKIIQSYTSGTTVKITVMRASKGSYSEITLNATLGSK